MENLRYSLQAMRETEEMCDISVISKEGKKFPAHRLVLAASSPVFKAMVTQDFKERVTKEIRLPDIDEATLAAILDFIYTGELKMTNENALDLFVLSDRMELSDLFASCIVYIQAHIDPLNCLGIQRIAERYNQTSLEKNAGSFLMRNFQKFAETDDFLELTPKELLGFLWKDELNIEKEENLIELVFRWIDHDPDARNAELESMMRSLRYPLMNFDFVEGRFRSLPRLKQNASKSITRLVKTIYKGCFQIFNRITNNPYPSLPCLKLRYRLPSQIILLYGGWNRGRTLDMAECYNNKTGAWYPADHLKDEQCKGRCYFGIESLNGIIYVTGGYDGRTYLNTVRTFDPSTKEWSSITPMHYRRCFTTTVSMGTDLYVLAGFDGQQRLTSMEKYCTLTKQWTVVGSLNIPRSDGTAVVHNGKIYIFGGYAGDSLNSAEVFHPNTNVWYTLPDMRIKRSGASAVSLHPHENKIMVLGGYNGSSRVASVEIYDIDTDTWSYGPSMSQERSNFATCTLENKLYVMGGYTGSTTLRDVEILDLKEYTWQFGRPINSSRSAMKAVRIDISQAEDFFDQLNDMAHRTESSGSYEMNNLEGSPLPSSDDSNDQ